MTFLLLVGGLGLLLAGGEMVVKGSVEVASRLHLPRLLIGVVIVGFGTSLPEFLVTYDAAVAGAPGLAVGNIFGSNISNSLLIMGLAGLFFGVNMPGGNVRRDALLLLALSVGVVLLGLQGVLEVWQGALLFSLLIAYTGYEIWEGKKAGNEDEDQSFEDSPPKALNWFFLTAKVLVGFAGLFFGARFFVEGAMDLAVWLGVSNTFIGLSVAALGTSLPELAATVVAAKQGQTDMAYGNIVGSNVFNILGVLGFAAIIQPLEIPEILVKIDGPVMILSTALLFFLLLWKGRLTRTHGALLVGLYLVYISSRYFLGGH